MEKYVTQEECKERRNRIAEDYEILKQRVNNHGKEIDTLNYKNIREDERIKHIENTFGILSKIMISVVAALALLVIKGALSI